MSELLAKLNEAVITGNAGEAKSLTERALAEKLDPETIINEGLIAAMAVVGEKFKTGELFVPEMLIAARAMYASLDLLRPLLTESQSQGKGTIVIGTVKGDLHDIGKNLVAMMMEGAGLKIVNLGTDVSPEKFVAAIREYKPRLVGMSALLTTTMPAMKQTIEAIKAAGLRDQVSILIGGAPVTQKYCDEIGADGYAADASSAAQLALKFATK